MLIRHPGHNISYVNGNVDEAVITIIGGNIMECKMNLCYSAQQ